MTCDCLSDRRWVRIIFRRLRLIVSSPSCKFLSILVSRLLSYCSLAINKSCATVLWSKMVLKMIPFVFQELSTILYHSTSSAARMTAVETISKSCRPVRNQTQACSRWLSFSKIFTHTHTHFLFVRCRLQSKQVFFDKEHHTEVLISNTTCLSRLCITISTQTQTAQ